jgi:small nuclear ribonucleoprotein (snRNP)-like protein
MSSRQQSITSNLTSSLKSYVDKTITVVIRPAHIQLKGTLVCYDQYSNLVLENVVETEKKKDGQTIETSHQGNIFIRGEIITNIIL